jgi:hypothetical protein
MSVVALRRGAHRVGRSGGPQGGSLATRDIRGHLWFYPFDSLKVTIGILGYYSLLVAAFNLIPLRFLDGATAWNLVPELIKRNRNRRNKPQRVVGCCAVGNSRTSSPNQIQP